MTHKTDFSLFKRALSLTNDKDSALLAETDTLNSLIGVTWLVTKSRQEK